jgi:hypothetical protein
MQKREFTLNAVEYHWVILNRDVLLHELERYLGDLENVAVVYYRQDKRSDHITRQVIISCTGCPIKNFTKPSQVGSLSRNG